MLLILDANDDEGDLDILPLFIRDHDLYNKVLRVRRDGLLAHSLDELGEGHWEALFALQYGQRSDPC